MENFSRTVFDTLSLLTPHDIDRAKLRVGNERDGAYIIVDLPPSTDIMSFGISNDIGFELEMAGRGHRLFMYDHTIDGVPGAHPAFTFMRQGICASGQAGGDLLPLEDHLANIADASDRLMLKIDVEGHEWSVFANISQELLGRFDQIMIEFHWLHLLKDPGFATQAARALGNINEQFTLYHIHANNCCELHIVEGFPVADVIEVSYVRTSTVTRRPSTTVYPTSLNKANHPLYHDHALLFFPFLPLGIPAGNIEEVVSRIVAEQAEAAGPTA